MRNKHLDQDRSDTLSSSLAWPRRLLLVGVHVTKEASVKLNQLCTKKSWKAQTQGLEQPQKPEPRTGPKVFLNSAALTGIEQQSFLL